MLDIAKNFGGIVNRMVDSSTPDLTAKIVAGDASGTIGGRFAPDILKINSMTSASDILTHVKGVDPAWVKGSGDNRADFQGFTEFAFSAHAKIRAMVAAPAAALDAAKSKLGQVQASAAVPLTAAQSAVTQIDNTLGSAANTAAARHAAAKAQIRQVMRGGADQAQATLQQAGQLSTNVRGAANYMVNTDVEGPMANMIAVTNALGDAGPRLQQNAAGESGIAQALAFNADPNVQQIGQDVSAQAAQMSADASTVFTNASNFGQGVTNVRGAYDTLRQGAAAVGTDADNIDANLQAAINGLQPNAVSDDVVLAHARTAVTGDFATGANLLESDFAGSNPGGVFPALDNAVAAANDAGPRLAALDPNTALNPTLDAMDANAGILAATGQSMEQRVGDIGNNISRIQTDDPDLQQQIANVNNFNGAVGQDAALIGSNQAGMSTAGVREVNDAMTNAINSGATSASQLSTVVETAKTQMQQMPADAQVKGAATELVTSYDGSVAASNAYSTAAAGPRAALATAQSTYQATVTPFSQAVDGAQSALEGVTQPLSELGKFIENLPNTTPGGILGLGNGWGHSIFGGLPEVDPKAVLKTVSNEFPGEGL